MWFYRLQSWETVYRPMLRWWTNVCWSRTTLNMLLSGWWILLSRSSQTCNNMFPVIKFIRNVKCHKMYQHKLIRSPGSSVQFSIGYVDMQICVLNWESYGICWYNCYTVSVCEITSLQHWLIFAPPEMRKCHYTPPCMHFCSLEKEHHGSFPKKMWWIFCHNVHVQMSWDRKAKILAWSTSTLNHRTSQSCTL